VGVSPAEGVKDALDGYGMPDLASLSDADLKAWEAEFLKVRNDRRALGYIDIIRAEAVARQKKRFLTNP
jgi:hypothetical protein